MRRIARAMAPPASLRRLATIGVRRCDVLGKGGLEREKAMRRFAVLGLLGLAACGENPSEQANFAAPPPMAEIVATPSARPTPAVAADAANAAAEEDAGNETRENDDAQAGD